MPLTVNDVLTFQEGAYLPAPLAGTVKKAWEVRSGQYGPFQGFVLDDGTGEISCTLSGNEDGTDFAPVKQGDQVVITPTKNGKGQLTGAKIGSYNGKNQIKVQGLRHLQNANASATQPQGQPAQGPAGGVYSHFQPPAPAPAQQYQQRQQAPTVQGKMTESQARQAWWRNFLALAGHFGYVGSWPALATDMPAHVLDLCGRVATTMLMGLEKGSLQLDPQGESMHPSITSADLDDWQRPGDPDWVRG